MGAKRSLKLPMLSDQTRAAADIAGEIPHAGKES